MTLIQRLQSPTPRFFQKVRKIGLLLTAISAALLTAPVALPSFVLTVAGYLGIAGAVATAVSQSATDEANHDETNKSRQMQQR